MAFDFLFDKTTMNQDLFNVVSEAVVGFMFDHGMIKKPVLLNIRDDRGIFDNLFKGMQKPLNAGRQQQIQLGLLLRTAGLQVFGAGIYVICKQIDFEHPLDIFTDAEIHQTLSEIAATTDIYELGINRIGITYGSSNDILFSALAATAFNAAYTSVGSDIFEPKNLRAYLQVFYNAGVTMLMN